MSGGRRGQEHHPVRPRRIQYCLQGLLGLPCHRPRRDTDPDGRSQGLRGLRPRTEQRSASELTRTEPYLPFNNTDIISYKDFVKKETYYQQVLCAEKANFELTGRTGQDD